ncbi:MAG: hypothetical protein GOVbin4206_33 [Prokaryotic dsDNA virus sp.]|nr:MAG: hypothetical protein GOVbin4206_33 [Prokaryotic dsDNA virus sp.]
MTRYYHATPKENLSSILQNGIEARFGEVYCSTSEETSARWICFTRRGSKEIITIPFSRPQGDKRMRLGADHSPVLTKILGVDEEGASFVSTETIPPKDILIDQINVWQNPFYSPEAEQALLKALKQNQDILMQAGADAIKNEIIGDEEE